MQDYVGRYLVNQTRTCAIAEGPREALVKSSNYKKSHLKNGVPDLSYGIICVFLRLSVLIQYRNMTDTHKQTDRHTTTAYTALSIAVSYTHLTLPTILRV